MVNIILPRGICQIMKILLFILVVVIIIVGSIFLLSTRNQNKPAKPIQYSEIESELFDQKGYQSKISLFDSLRTLTQKGAIDQNKINSLYGERPELQKELRVLSNNEDEPIILTDKNASLYLNLLWPIGLANQMKINEKSPLKQEKNINSFASTGGWSLGQAKEGGKYFNKYQIIELTQAQEKTIYQISSNIYRPCCNNNTFFQDCNHGSAMLGLLELGVSQGLTEDELYREALTFNSYWFPNQYLTLAFYFQKINRIPWQNVNPKIILSKDYSSISGWQNIDQKLQALGFLKPKSKSSSGC